ncbi:hypothetical protein MRX96_044613 [Rhipicephalus microplus]
MLDTASSKARFLSRAGCQLTLGHQRNILASLHQQHTRSSTPIKRGGLNSSIRSLPRSLVLRSTRPNSDYAGPHLRAAVGDSGVGAAFPMHDAPVVERLEARTLNYTKKTALGPVLLRASPTLQALHMMATPLAVAPYTPWTGKAAAGYRLILIFEYRNYKTELRCEAGIVEPLDGRRMATIKATDGDHQRWRVGTSWEQGKQTVRGVATAEADDKQVPVADAPQTQAGPRSASRIADAVSPERGGRAAPHNTRYALDAKSGHRGETTWAASRTTMTTGIMKALKSVRQSTDDSRLPAPLAAS